MKNIKIRKKLYTEQSKAKKYRKMKEGLKKLKFMASKTGVGGPGPLGSPGSAPALTCSGKLNMNKKNMTKLWHKLELQTSQKGGHSSVSSTPKPHKSFNFNENKSPRGGNHEQGTS